MGLMCMKAVLAELDKHTRTYTQLYSCNRFLQPSAVQPSALLHSKASRSTGENGAGLWVVETERWRCGDEGRRGEA